MQEQIQGFQLSPQQKRLWLLQPNSKSYNCVSRVNLVGNLHLEILKQALLKVINRHEILRTTFYCPKGFKVPIQVIQENSFYSLTEHNLSNPESLAVELDNLFHLAIQHNFDWKQGSLLQLQLVAMPSNQHVLLISLPSLCGDVGTLNNFVQELSRAYAACLQGEEITDEPLQYADIAQWQNEILELEEPEAELEYWHQLDFSHIGDFMLPFANRTESNREFHPQFITQEIAQELVAKIEMIAQQYQTSVSVVFLTCWQILLWRLSPQSNLLIGLACDGRNHEELQNSLGLLVKYLPFSCHLEENYRFDHLLKNVTEATDELYAAQAQFSWEHFSAGNSQDPNLSFFPLCFEFVSFSTCQATSDVSFSINKHYSCTERFAVKLACVRRDETCITELHYDANVFAPDVIQRLANQFEMLLASVADNPTGAIAQFDILSPIERQELVIQFNNTQTAVPAYACIHQWFESQVERTPDHIAVICENRKLTYHELNQQANQLAHYLQNIGVGPEVMVGICTDRSIEMMIAVLGILKAGGAYVPLDPTYPRERLAFIFNDTRSPVLLTQQKLLAILPEHSALVLCLDSDWQKIASESQENPISKVASENLAYVIYTSGSTGQPKGTLIPHRGLVNYLAWCTQAYAVEQGKGTVVHSPLAFDLTITSLFSPLLVGQPVELLPDDFSIESLSAALQKSHDLSLVKITPSQLLLLSQQLSPSQAAGKTKAFVIGGENLQAQSLTFWQEFAPETQLVNEYGPTETVVGCCIYQVPPGSKEFNSVPIGRPIANTQIYLLDSALQPVVIGVVGELYIGGAGLARGYLHRPELTAQKFIPHPFSQEPGARLYKTGDLARFRPDGQLEFLGRVDDQVKIRGFRIELGEIEKVLAQHPALRETVAMVREDVPGDQRLVAYVVPTIDVTPHAGDLQNYLHSRLPEYMVPSMFVILNALPLTINGKVDKRSLPAPAQAQLAINATMVTPRTPTEEILAGIWSQVLGNQQISIHDNFFELGGHSLLATQVMSRLHKAFQIDIPLRYLFESPTIAGLAEHIETATRSGSELTVVPLESVSRDQDLPLSFSQQRLWLLDQLEPNNSLYNIPAAVRLTGLLNITALEQSFNELIKRHEVLRTRFVAVDGQPFQVIEPTLSFTLELVDLRSLSPTEQETEVEKLAQEEANRPFELTKSPLLRCVLLQLDDTENVLLVTMHHIISDAWSVTILIRELGELYKTFATNQPSPLTALPIQYADFAIWQRQYLQGETLKTQLTYWKQQLKGAPPLLQLPIDRPRPAVRTFRGATQPFTLSKPLTEEIKNLSNREGATLFMTLLAAFKTLLYCYSGQEDIIVGSPIANRTRAELEELIGFFVNTLVLRTDLSDNPTFHELLGRVRSHTLKAYAHQDLPFEKLIEELQPERNPSYNPLFQVWFVLQNVAMPSLELENLNITSLNIHSDRAKHDLRLELAESEEGLIGSIGYRVDLFEQATIARMAQDFESLLVQITAQPQIKLSNLVEILTETNRQEQMLKEKELESSSRQKLKMTKRKSISGL